METQDARTLSPEAQQDLRTRVVRAIVEQNMTKAEAVRVFGVSKTAVFKWLKAYHTGGPQALAAQPQGRPKEPTLSEPQGARLIAMITNHGPEQFGLNATLWTREQVAALIQQQWGLQRHVTTVGRWLRQWGLTPQKPLRRAYEQDPEAVQIWLDEDYPAIQRQARQEGAEIQWGDQMGLRSDHQTGTSYGLRGQTPVVPGTGRRFRCQLMATVTNQGRLRFWVFTGRFTAEVLVDFLRRLVGQADCKVYLIVDQHPVHCSKKVRQWVSAHSDQIALFFLPSYSPELNPSELLNQDVKSNALGRRRPQDQATLISDVRAYLHSTQKRSEIVKNYFQEEHVAYAS